MLDIGLLREDIDGVRARLAQRGHVLDVETFQNLDGQHRRLVQHVEKLRQMRNTTSEQIGRLVREKADVSSKRNDMKELSQEIKEIEAQLKASADELFRFMSTIPNLPGPSVPVGLGEDENVEVRRVGRPPELSFEARAHWNLGRTLGILDLERAAKVAGTRFPLLVGTGARLERALINFMLDVHTREHGYREIMPPFVANSRSFYGTGNLPKFEEDLFAVRGTDYYLVPTAEVPVTNVYQDEILDGERLPIKFAAYTPCFRSEAGSYGKDVRGIFRQHQFNKVELVKFARPETSDRELESLVRDAECILDRLELHYRVVIHSTGDMGFAAAKSYDIEVWLPSQRQFREISSCSNFEDFQARRANIRFRPHPSGRPRYVHTLNGSGLAVGRTWLALIENYQQDDQSVVIPSALRPYLDQEVIRPESVI